MAEAGELRKLPLNDLHAAVGARFGGFAGWSMPISYPLGVLKEHLHTRENAGLFDISHMKLLRLTGCGVEATLALACPVEPDEIDVGQSKYTFLLNEQGGIIDDLIVTRLTRDSFMLVVNAGNADTDVAHLRAIAPDFDCTVEPLDRVLLALQGPDAESVLAGAGLDLSHLTFMQGEEPRQDWFATRSGYTGEDGFEIAMPPSEARDFAEKLLADERVAWVGLAARDSLRLEAGLCLHGNDIDTSTDPVEAGLLWAIPKSLRLSGPYIGVDGVGDTVEAGPSRKRVGLRPEGRQPVRGGAELFDGEGNPAGRVTSGGFGPSAGFPVAMGYVTTALASPGTRLFAEVRGNRIPVDVHPLPFTPHRYRKG